MQTLKLAIDNVVEVPVKFTIKVKGVAKLFAFSFTAHRLDQDEISSRLEETGKKTKDFMADLMTDWANQRLVLTATDEPADFSPEALEMMLNAPGVATACFNAYIKNCGATEKN
jgi:hypothetical protein